MVKRIAQSVRRRFKLFPNLISTVTGLLRDLAGLICDYGDFLNRDLEQRLFVAAHMKPNSSPLDNKVFADAVEASSDPLIVAWRAYIAKGIEGWPSPSLYRFLGFNHSGQC